MYWKFTYRWWFSISKSTMFVKADTESDARKKFNSQFGYEEVDIEDCEQVTEEEVLRECVVQ